MAAVVGQAFASAIVGQVVIRLSSPIWEGIESVLKLNGDLAKMKETLMTLEAVLKDAESRSGRDNEEGLTVCLWLKRLKTAAYEIDDMLSDFEDKIPKKKEKVLDNMVQDVRNFFSSSNQVKLRLKMSNMIKDMRTKLSFIADEHKQFDFYKNTVRDQDATGRETASVFTESAIIGRDEEKEKLVRILLDDRNEQVTIIPIVGMGGLGKTTLARLLYNDQEVSNAFKLKAWSYVSTKFDLKKIGEDIIGSSEQKRTKQIVCNEVSKKLEGKRFLLVLDDVWEEDGEKLDELKDMLQNSVRGCKVILTTRNTHVATLICGNEPHVLRFLSDEQCWILFSQKAFVSETEITDKKFVEVGKEIVKKCKGVPLAARVLGSVMRSKGINSWYKLRDDHLWEFEENSGSSSKNLILPSLKLSYYNMPSHLKMCFAYCSIFPKGSFIDMKQLIREWIWLGFIRQVENLEQLAEEYVEPLIRLSFLQRYDNFLKDSTIFLHMHDLMHDLAMSIAHDEVIILDGKKERNVNTSHCRYARLLDYSEASSAFKLLPKTLRALFLDNCTFELESKCSDVFNKFKGLHVLCLDGSNIVNLSKSIGKLAQLRYLSAQNLEIQTLPKAISQLHKLCFLNLSHCNHLTQLNDSITKLKNLKHLDLSSCIQIRKLPTSLGDLNDLLFLNLSYCAELQELPESIDKLENLEHLDLSSCTKLKKLPESFVDCSSLLVLKLNDCYNLQAFPESINNLSNLETLDLSDCWNLAELPYSSFGDLKKLKVLNLNTGPLNNEIVNIASLVDLTKLEYFYVRNSNIRELENLNCLEGKLQIYNLENEKTPQEINNELLCHKSKLHYLTLRWSWEVPIEPSQSGILEKLRPHGNLQCLHILNCPATEFPNWMINLSVFLPNLTEIILEDLQFCNSLPPLGQLQNLQRLSIIGLSNIKKVDKAFAGDSMQPFKNLTDFTLMRMKLIEWSTLISNRGGANIFMFPNLVNFCVVDCCLNFKPSLPESINLVIERGEIISSRGSAEFPNFKTLSTRIQFTHLPANKWGVLESFSALRNLEIYYCPGLISLPETIRGLTSLESLEVDNCDNLIELGENLRYLISLKKLKINFNKNLASLPESLENLTSLEELIIWNCPTLESLPESIQNLSLKALRIRVCKKLLENCLKMDKDKFAHIKEVEW